jgi:hypothetical protein
MAIYLAFESLSSRDFKILIPAIVEGRTNPKPSHFIVGSFPPLRFSQWEDGAGLATHDWA